MSSFQGSRKSPHNGFVLFVADSVKTIGRGSKGSIQVERYYYTDSRLFEQSIDIYRPICDLSTPREVESPDNIAGNNEHPPNAPGPIVALVVGSAWLGHRSFVYGQTSWWNSSGPKTVAKLGYVCVCIRHRGSFPKLLLFLLSRLKNLSQNSAWILACCFAVLVALAAVFIADQVHLSRIIMNSGEHFISQRFVCSLFAIALLLMLLEVAGIGSASFDDMTEDVMEALVWCHKNKTQISLGPKSPLHLPQSGKSNFTAKPSNVPFIFGGYSSGGHVAATIMQNPQLWKDRNIPSPDEYFSAVLYISPVLATRPFGDVLDPKYLTKKTSSLSSSSLGSSISTPSLASSDKFQETIFTDTDELTSSSHSTFSAIAPTAPPTWLTTFLVKAVFGPDHAHTIPSPIHTHHKSPPIPHIFLGCKYEAFGLNWLDLLFCSEMYSNLLRRRGVNSRFVAVNSDHWNILNSESLKIALGNEIKWVTKELCKGRR